METKEHPRLRPHLEAVRDTHDPRFAHLHDPLRISSAHVRIAVSDVGWLAKLDGKHSLLDLQVEAMKHAGGEVVPLDAMEKLISKLDAALMLDSVHFRDYLAGPDRLPSCIGSYEADPVKLRKQLKHLFTAPGGAGLPGAPGCRANEGRLRAILAPHIDYGRGGITYGYAFKELVERTTANLFVIVATSHYSAHRFTLTRKHFSSPLGTIPTDQEYIDRLESLYGPGLFDDPLAHLPEHSVELEAVLLQYLYEGKRPIRIVPLLVGSFHDCVNGNCSPDAQADIQRMIHALRTAEQEVGEPVCTIISGDLAHIGPKFDDPEPLREPYLSQSRAQDEALLERASACDRAGYFDIIAAEGDARRICGLPPTFVSLAALQPRHGETLHYGRYVHPQGMESVSFAAAVFSD